MGEASQLHFDSNCEHPHSHVHNRHAIEMTKIGLKCFYSANTIDVAYMQCASIGGTRMFATQVGVATACFEVERDAKWMVSVLDQ